MAIFLMILKTIGIVLLWILLIVLILILYLLLAPFSFKVTGEFDEDISLHAQVKSFLHLFQFHFKWNKNDTTYFLSLFGENLKLWPKDEKNESDNDSIKQEDTYDSEEELDEEVQFNIREDLSAEDESYTEDGSDIEDELYTEDGSDIEDESYIEDEVDDLTEEESSIFDNDDIDNAESSFKNFINKIKSFFIKISKLDIKSKISAIIKKIKGFYKKCTDESNKKCVKKCLEIVFKLLKSFRMNLKGTDLTFGIGDPDVTGKITAVLSLLPFVYSKKTYIVPDFNCDDPYAEGIINLKGRIYLVCVVYFIIVIFLDKDARKIFDLIGGK